MMNPRGAMITQANVVYALSAIWSEFRGRLKSVGDGVWGVF